MTDVELDGKKVVKMKCHMTGDDGEFLWIEFELEDGTKESAYYMKGAI
jgi:hypothetical protein